MRKSRAEERQAAGKVQMNCDVSPKHRARFRARAEDLGIQYGQLMEAMIDNALADVEPALKNRAVAEALESDEAWVAGSEELKTFHRLLAAELREGSGAVEIVHSRFQRGPRAGAPRKPRMTINMSSADYLDSK